MKKSYIIIALTLSLFFFFSTTTPVNALDENTENELLENYKKHVDNYENQISEIYKIMDIENTKVRNIQENLEDLETLISRNSENIEKIKQKIENMDTEIDSLQSSISDTRGKLSDMDKYLDSYIENLEDYKTKILEMQENYRNTTQAYIDKKSENIENKLLTKLYDEISNYEELENTVETEFFPMTKTNNQEIREMKNDDTGQTALYLAILAVILGPAVGALIHKRIEDGKYAKKYPKSAQEPVDRIWAAINLLEHRLKTEAPREEIESAERKCEILRERWPEKFRKVLKDADLEEVDKSDLEKESESSD